MPLMIYIGDKKKLRKSLNAQAVRKEKAAARGFDEQSIEAMKRGQASSNRGSGATSWSGYQGSSSSSATPSQENVDWSGTSWGTSWLDRLGAEGQ